MPKGVYGTRNWTPAQVEAVNAGIERGESYAVIAKRIGRTTTAVHVWTKRNIESVRAQRPMSARDVHRLMGMCEDGKWAPTMIRRGWLKAQRGFIAGRSRVWVVTEEALLAFLGNPEHWHTWNPNRVRRADLRAWALETRTERFFTIGQVARRYVVTTAAVAAWIDRGELEARRFGNHWIPESALVGFVPPFERSHAGTTPRRFTPAEDLHLLEMRDSGRTWQSIATVLGRHVGPCHNRYARLNASAAQEAA